MKTKTQHVRFKAGISFLAGLFIFALVVNAGTITIPASISNALQVIQRMFITDDGTQSGNVVMDINTWGSVIVYGPLLDAWLVPYITGAVLTESDPIWLAMSGDYYTKTEIGAFGYITWYIETDPIWMAAQNNYYTKNQIDNKWFLLSYTETDPYFLSSAVSGVTAAHLNNRDLAYSRGNHANMHYITGETDPLWNFDKTNYYTTIQIDQMIQWFAGWIIYKWTWDYSTGDLPSDVTKWDMFVIISSPANSWFDFHMESPDQIIANKDVVGPTTSGDWDLVEMDMQENDPVYAASASANVTNQKIINWDAAYSRGDHKSAWYITWYTESDPVWNLAQFNYYTTGQIDANYYTKNWIDTHTVGATGATWPQGPQGIQWAAGPRWATGEQWIQWAAGAKWDTGATWSQWPQGIQWATGAQGIQWATGVRGAEWEQWPRWYTGATWATGAQGIQWIQGVVWATGAKWDTGATWPQWATGAQGIQGIEWLSWAVAGLVSSYVPYRGGTQFYNSNITTTASGTEISWNLFVMHHINIGSNDSHLYPFYIYTNNTGDDWANYFAIDGPDDQQKWFQIGVGSGTSDFDRAWYTDRNEDGDKMYFQNGKSMRDILTMAAWGRIGFNIPTLLGTKTPPDGFSIYPQYFDYIARYDGSTYYDYTSKAYISSSDPFILLSSASDTLLIGKLYPRRATYINVDTPAGTPWALEVKYSKDGWIWWEVVWLSDSTDRLKKAGNISWSLDSFKSTREKRTVNGQNLYWIQISLSSLAGNLPTSHLISNLWVNRFALYAGAGDVNPMFAIDSNARLGILPPELTGKYEMGKLPGMTTSQVEIVSNNPLKSDLVNYIANDSSVANSSVFLAKSKWTVDAKTAVTSSDVLWGIYGYGYDGATFRNAAGITFGVDGGPDVLDMPGKISFNTSLDGTAVPVERMTIKNDGKVGIGTTTPTNTLTVSGDINVTSGHGIYDGAGNPYITSAALSGHLLTETDPVWTLDKPTYYTKAEVDLKLISTAGMSYKWAWDYSTGDLPDSPLTGYFYVVAVMWNFNWLILHIGDMFIANKSKVGITTTWDWDLIDLAQTETDPVYMASAAANVTNLKIANRDNAYSRGDHRLMWYITGYIETDPSFAVSVAHGITSWNISNWQTAYSRGDRSTQWFLTSYTETDPVRSAASANYYTKSQIDAKWYLTWVTLTSYVQLSQTGNRNTAFWRGNHATVGYLTGGSLVGYLTGSALTSYVQLSQTGNRNTAFWRGNHATVGYLTGGSLTNYYTKTEIDNKWYLTNATADFWYTLDIQALTSNPTQSQTIYLGQLPAAPTTTAATRKIYIRHGGTIKIANIYSYASTQAGSSAATWSWYIRLNNTTDYLIQAVSLGTAERIRANSNLNIPVVAGDYVEIKFVNPAWGWWASIPQGVTFGWYIYIQ